MVWAWSRGRWHWLVGGLLLAAFLLTHSITRLAVSPTVGVDSPALSTLLVALGGSRGILSEILWWRIGDLQRQNRFAELVPLTDLLVTLEPTTPDVWVFNAWNLAYNISALHQDPAERWRWVKRGFALLERGLRATPKAQPLLRQLGWMWENKLGTDLDEAAAYYRAHLAELSIPSDAEAFAKRLGATPDWTQPLTHALYWYERAGHGRDTLRATINLLHHSDSPALLPFFVRLVEAERPNLSTRQAQQVHEMAATFHQRYPQQPDLNRFLKEPWP